MEQRQMVKCKMKQSPMEQRQMVKCKMKQC